MTDNTVNLCASYMIYDIDNGTLIKDISQIIYKIGILYK